MKTNLKTAFLINTVIVYTILALGIFAILASIYTTNKSKEHIYAISTDGNIIPLQLQNRRDNLKIEAKHHITMLIDNFYNINQLTVNQKKNSTIEKALWLGDLQKIHQYRIANSFYNRCLQYSVEYSTLIHEIKVSDEKNGIMQFECFFDLIISGDSGIKTEKQLYTIHGLMRTTDRNFPYNPHGLYLFNITELTKKYED